ncbi:MAG: Uma2 family endonuclease [Bacteroidota bacterium]
MINVEEYYWMAEVGILKPTDHVELINGEIIEKISPVGSKHASVVGRMTGLVVRLIGHQYMVRIQSPVRLSADSEPEPDLAIVASKEDDYADAHPGPFDIHLIMEVAHTTLEYDQTTKLKLYASSGIPCYWVVNIPENQIEVYTNPEKGDYKNKEVFSSKGEIPLLGTHLSFEQVLK